MEEHIIQPNSTEILDRLNNIEAWVNNMVVIQEHQAQQLSGIEQRLDAVDSRIDIMTGQIEFVEPCMAYLAPA
jgi:hypothetical protein